MSASRRPGGLIFLGIVAAGYALLALKSPAQAQQALYASAQILWKLLPMLAVVIVLLGLFQYLLNPRALSRHLGSESGAKAWLIAAAGGVLSHGPSYVWYPMLADLRARGVRDGLIAAFLYVRAIKLPWLPVMVDYFGWTFTLTLSAVLLLFGVVQGVLMERLEGQRAQQE